ncbi:hypothetical protein CAEBREN_29142 [Caenorhabditis brenneri]|uniref:Receptor L-domain domain-containing protein n=1 Tax=Caenorhabditis brenneri TaxID=135651 RepID=G0M8R8_CAEBE|nr:hypothetical protein CAEBREN_29142 [Caenorhabditis brenneri]
MKPLFRLTFRNIAVSPPIFLRIFINLFSETSCIFSEDYVTSQNLKLFPTNCSTVCANIVLNQDSNLLEKQVTLAFRNMRTLYGSLKVQATNFTSGKFLEGLEAVECDPDGSFTWEDNGYLAEIGITNLSRCSCNIDINFNIMQTRLNLPSLKNFSSITSNSSQFTVSINSMPSEFCITTDEMENFMTNENVDIQFDKFSYCNSTAREKICRTDRFSFEKLESGCTRVIGYIKVTNLREAHTEKLRTVKWIFGTLDIDSTVLVSIDFLDNLEYVVSLDPDYYAIKIVNNRKLMNISIPNIKVVFQYDFLIIVFSQKVKANHRSWVEFFGNPENVTKIILENTPFCKNKDKPYYDKTRIEDKTCGKRMLCVSSMFQTTSQQDACPFFSEPTCIFADVMLAIDNLKLFPTNCSSICGNLEIDEASNLTEEQLISAFKNVKTVLGSLGIYRTNLTTLNFLAGLETIECDESLSFVVEHNDNLTEVGMVNLTRCACNVLIHLNGRMKQLNLPKLKTFSSLNTNISQYDMYIRDLHPDACIDIQEIENFIANRNLYMNRLSERYCELPKDPIFERKTCTIPYGASLSQLDFGCVRVLGDLTISRKDQNQVKKLENLTILFGKLEIRGTTLTKVDFLNNLEYLAALDAGKHYLETREGVRSPEQQWYRQYDSKKLSDYILMEQPNLCYSIKDVKNETDLYITLLDSEICVILISRIISTTNEFFETKCNPHCIFSEESITSEKSKKFPTNCSTVCGYIQIDETSNLSENQLSTTFKSIKAIFGSLRIYKTKLTSIKFLAGLEAIECGKLDNFSSASLNISQYEMYINHLHPDFCIDIQEMENFIINRNLYMKTLPNTFCEAPNSENYSSGEKLCALRNSSLSNLETGCVKMLGDILIRPGDEDQVHKLEKLRIVFGRIDIKETNLTRIDFLNQLEYIATLQHFKESFITADNKNLIEISLPNFKMARSDLQWWFKTLENKEVDKSIMAQPHICNSIRDIFNKTVLYHTTLGGISCEDTLSFIVEENEELTELGMVSLTRCACDVLFNVNHNMMQLNLPNLKNFSSVTGNQSQHEMYISNLHPDACIDIQEMENFITNRNLLMKKLPERYCDTAISASKEKVCVSKNESLWQLYSDCVKIIGDIVIELGDEHLVHKLKNLRIMFGKIKIFKTTLTKVDFLNSLEYLATLEGGLKFDIQM